MTSTKSLELVEAEIALEGHRSHADERNLIKSLAALPGVQEPVLYGGLLVLQCDPSIVSRESISDAAEDVGLTISWMKMQPIRSGELDELAPD